jgi:hypothetical protein
VAAGLQVPLPEASVIVHTVAEPDLTVTVPVGVPPEGEVTVAVSLAASSSP